MGFWTAIPIIGTVINKIFDCVDDNIHSPEERANLKASLEKLQYNSDFQLALKQLGINLSDSKGNWFQRCWRPSIGYICSASLFFASLVPLATCVIIWSVDCFRIWQILPFPMQFNTLTEMLGTNLIALLGMSYFRTREKEKGVQDKHE